MRSFFDSMPPVVERYNINHKWKYKIKLVNHIMFTFHSLQLKNVNNQIILSNNFDLVEHQCKYKSFT